MLHIFKVELWKAFHNIRFRSAFIIACMLSLSDSIQSVIEITPIIRQIITFDSYHSFRGVSLFVLWMGLAGRNIGSMIYFMIWPLIASFPFGSSYWMDHKTGYEKQLLIRCSQQKYFLAKYTATFVSGGFIVSFPLLQNLLVDALIFPITTPRVIDSIMPIFNGSFLSSCYYTYPWLYSIVWLLVTFFLGGSTACLCFVTASFPRSQTTVILFPFVLYYLLSYIGSTYLSTLLYNTQHISLELSPFALLQSATMSPNPWWLIGSFLLISLITSFSTGYCRVVLKHE